jgi:hypothetical protein
MKTARRQELRTNELSQQLDQISVYVKQNVAMLTVVIAVAAIVTAGGFWYVKNKQNQVMDGWAMLNDSEVLKDMSSAVGQFRTLAEEHRSPALTLAARLRIGEIAMAKVANPESSTATASSDPNWSETALDAFSRVVSDYPNDVGALGQSYISLGVLAENKSDNEKARQFYQKIVDDARFAGTPFVVQAKFRLEGLPKWSMPVVFAPAPVTVPSPEIIPPTLSSPLMPTTRPTSAPAGGIQIVPTLPAPPKPAATQPKG